MAEDDAEGFFVNVEDGIEHFFAGAIEPAVALVFLGLQENGAEHGRGGQRDDEGDRDSGREDDGEFAEEAADKSAHEQDGDEDGDEGGADGDDGEADLFGSNERGFHRCFAFFEMAGDVFDDHDGIVDDEAGGDGEGHEGEVVDGIAAEIHDAEGADEGDGDGDAGDEGCAQSRRNR